MKTLNYGIDAPEEIYKLLLIMTMTLIVTLFPAYLLLIKHPWVSYTLLFVAVATVLGTLALIGLVYLSSKYRKVRLWDTLLKSADIQDDELILDVGCGHGLQLINAASYLTTGKVTGIDIWRKEDQFNNSIENTLENAKKAGVLDRIELVTGNMLDMPFANAYFNSIFASMSICNIKNRPGRMDAVREIARVLKPGGKLIFVDFFYTKEYVAVLEALNFSKIHRSGWRFDLFPPVRIVSATKPI